MGFTKATGNTIRGSLVRRLIPTADKLRDLYTKFGLRAYSVRIIRTRWSGGSRGMGVESVSFTRLVEPTPKVSALDALTATVTGIGRMDEGTLYVTEISGTYTEEMLRGVDDDGTEPGADEDVYWEVEFVRPDGKEGERRRFVPSAVPAYDPGGLQWSVTLVRQQQSRARNGEVR